MFFEIRCIAQAVLSHLRPPAAKETQPEGLDRFESGLPTPRRHAFAQADALQPPLWQQAHAALLRERLAFLDAETWEDGESL